MKNFKFCNMGPWHLIDTYIFRQHGGTYSVTVVPLLCEDTVEPSVWVDPHVKTAAYKLFQNLLISFGRADLILGQKWTVLIPWCFGTARALTKILI